LRRSIRVWRSYTMNSDLEKLFDQAVSLTGTEREEFITRNRLDTVLRREVREVAGFGSRRFHLLQDAVMDAASSVLHALHFHRASDSGRIACFP